MHLTRTASDNTKIERVVEAVEDFANAIIDSRTAPANFGKFGAGAAATVMLDKRGELAEALGEFLAPRLRVIPGGRGRQDYTADTPEAEQPECLQCHRHYCCGDSNCPDWHAAVRAVAAKELPKEPDHVA